MQGQFLKDDILHFRGTIDSSCKGVMAIPDISVNKFQYDQKEYTIFWKDQQTGEKWVKGKNFYNMRFIENKDYLVKIVEVIKVIKTSSQKGPTKSNNFYIIRPLDIQMKKLKIDLSSKKIYSAT